MRKKILVLTLLTMVLVFALAAPAFAERLGGYWRATLSIGTSGSTKGSATGIGINPALSQTVDAFGNVAQGWKTAFGFTKDTGPGLTSLGTPHGGYTTTSGKCKVCHAVHGAGEYASNYLATRTYTGTDGVLTNRAGAVYGEGGVTTEALLRSTKAQACEFCHVGTQAFAKPDLYASPLQNTFALSNYENSTANVVTNPPAILNPIRSGHYSEHEELATGYEGCVSCHSVHGGGALQGSTILKLDPAKDVVAYEVVNGGFGSIKGPVKNQHQFCEDCHNGTNYTPADVGGVAQPPVELTSTVQFRENWPNCSCHDSAQSWLSDTTNQLGAGFFANHDGRSHINTLDQTDESNLQIAWGVTAFTTEGPTAGSNACALCHKNNTNPFPHFSSANIELIGGYTKTTAIDGVCVSCHWNSVSAPTEGVGITF